MATFAAVDFALAQQKIAAGTDLSAYPAGTLRYLARRGVTSASASGFQAAKAFSYAGTSYSIGATVSGLPSGIMQQLLRTGYVVGQTINYLLYDDFTRPDNTIIGAGAAGPAPVELSGDWAIVGNKLRSPAAGESNIQWEVGASTYRMECALDGHTGDSGPIFRAVDFNNFMLIVLIYGSNSSIYQRNGGAYIIDGTSANVAWVDGDVIRVDVSPTAITVYQNDVAKLTSTSGFAAGGTKVGFRSNGGAMNFRYIKVWVP